jgi:hypothetical protein
MSLKIPYVYDYMAELCRSNPESSKFERKCKLDKEKLCMGSTRGLILAVVRPATIKAAISEW